ncbi:hypothetical protein ADL27_38460 [Streptomyces sp. NRRL F-6602]|uniref:hypothetical protein n=1 Tax=Streptomyces sp. NRRL F-5630 TaxID=1463864 RepID=UPI0004CABC51|nr:hypothetical protein [Streptomyces sp. NRRL F-5630]KPC89901.1 hypothetical protein ADL27_38460 [Streptomyces sp. NRRL F-6602]
MTTARQAPRTTNAPGPGVACAGAIVGLGFIPFHAWLLMLALGAAHHEVSASVPAMGFGATLLIFLGVGVVAGVLRSLFRKTR